MNLGGFKNKEVVVDLTNGTVNYRPINEDDAKKYIGGRGLGVKYVLIMDLKLSRYPQKTFFVL